MTSPVQILVVIEGTSCEKQLKNIIFACLKLLTHFCGHLEQNGPKLKWGYNFYNCPRATIAKHRSKSFTDFTEETFKVFENDIHSVSELVFNRHISPINSVQLPHAKILERALTESLYDYPWVKPDLSSPEARSKCKVPARTWKLQERNPQNFILVVAACPKSSLELCEFFGNENFAGMTFVNSALQQLFVENGNVRLLWLDCGVPFATTVNEQNKIAFANTIKNELRITNGDLIPLKIFSQLDTRLCVPLSSLLSYYLDTDTQKGICVSGKIIFQHESTYEVCKLEFCTLTKLHHPAATTRYKPESPVSLVPVGTINENEICALFSKIAYEFICFYKSDTEIDLNVERKMQNIMAGLKTRNLAMVVNCDHSNVGVILPFEDINTCACGLLYIFQCEMSSMNPEKLHQCAPKGTALDNVAFSADMLEPWFIPETFPDDVKSLLNRNAGTTNVCHLINGKLRKFYLSSLAVEKKNPQMNAASKSKMESPNPKEVADTLNFNFSDRAAKIVAKSKISKTLLGSQHKLLSVKEKLNCHEQLKKKQEELQNTFADVMTRQALLDETQLKSNVRDLYDKILAEQLSIVDGTKSIVHLIYNFANTSSQNPLEYVEKFRQECFSADTQTETNGNATKPNEVRICMINVIWELELHLVSANEQNADVSDKVTAQLRMIPIHSDIATLSTFLQDIIFENYYPILENVLSNVCEDLNFPLPNDGVCSSPTISPARDITENEFGSPSSISVASNPMSNSSNLLGCYQEKRRVVGKHPSFADLMQVRQISLPKKEVVVTRKDKSDEDGCKGRRSTRNARRNLFDSKSKEDPSTLQSKAQEKCFTPNGKRVLKTKVVAETPERKQVSNVILSRQACSRRLHMEDPTDTNKIIQESPDKQIHTASRNKLFYSTSRNSRPLTPVKTSQTLQHYLLSPPKFDMTQVTSMQCRNNSLHIGSSKLFKRKYDSNEISPAAKIFVNNVGYEQLETCVPATPEKSRAQSGDICEERIISTPLRDGIESPNQHNFTLLNNQDCIYEESQCEMSPSIPLVTSERCDSPDASIHSDEGSSGEPANGSNRVLGETAEQKCLPSPSNKNNWSSPSVKSLLHLTSSPILMSKF